MHDEPFSEPVSMLYRHRPCTIQVQLPHPQSAAVIGRDGETEENDEQEKEAPHCGGDFSKYDSLHYSSILKSTCFKSLSAELLP